MPSQKGSRTTGFHTILCAALMITGISAPADASTITSTSDPVELRGLPGSTQNQGFAINTKGVIVGVSGTSVGQQAVRWNPDGVVARLPMPRRSMWSDASTINDAGVIAGSIDLRAARWNTNGTITWLTVPPGSTESYVIAINDRGVMVGNGLIEGTEEDFRALRWDTQGHVTVLATLPGGRNTVPTAINASGSVAGYVDVTSSRHAVWWTPDGVITDLGVLPGGNISIAWGINDSGTIAGVSQVTDGTRAVQWALDSQVTTFDLLPDAGNSARGVAINAHGTMVGDATTRQGDRHATLWTKHGAISDLGTLPGHVSSDAYAINDRGVVAGFSFDTNGNPHAARWTATAGSHLQYPKAPNRTGPPRPYGTQRHRGRHGVWTRAFIPRGSNCSGSFESSTGLGRG